MGAQKLVLAYIDFNLITAFNLPYFAINNRLSWYLLAISG